MAKIERMVATFAVVGALAVGGCKWDQDVKYDFRADGTATLEVFVRMNREMSWVVVGLQGICQELGPWAFNEDEFRIIKDGQIAKDEGWDSLYLGCHYVVGPIDTTRLLQVLAEDPERTLSEGRDTATLTIRPASGKDLLRTVGLCGQYPCEGVDMDANTLQTLRDLAIPVGENKIKMDVFLETQTTCSLEVRGEGLRSVKGVEWDESGKAYRFAGNCWELLGREKSYTATTGG